MSAAVSTNKLGPSEYVSFSDLLKGTVTIDNPTDTRVIAAFSGVEASADLVLTATRERTYMLIDALGTSGQAATIVSLLSAGASVAAAAADVFIPIRFLVTGTLAAATAHHWTVPDAKTSLISAQAELATAKKEGDFAGVVEGERAVEIAEMGVDNQRLYKLMGLSQFAVGTVGVLSSTNLGFAPVLTGHASSVAASAAGAALGGVYVARGLVMLNRSLKNYQMVSNFEAGFNSKKSVDEKVKYMKHVESRGMSYLNRRVDPDCLIEKVETGLRVYTAEGVQKVTRTLDEKSAAIDIKEYERRSKAKESMELFDGEEWRGTYTPKGFVQSILSLEKYSTPEAKKSYLVRVEKGIFSEKLKHKIAAMIATAMIIGGIIAIITSVFLTGGLSLVILGVASAVFFALMESVFLTYDSSSIFKWFRDSQFKSSLSPELSGQ